MKLSAWAKQEGIHYQTAWRWWKAGKLPVEAKRSPSGAVLVYPEVKVTGGAALYARVSSSDQKKDLETQLGRLAAHAAKSGMSVVATASEVGSGLNGHRPKLMKMLADPKIAFIVVEHRDRLMRFGSEYVESALAATGRKLVVIHDDEVKDDRVGTHSTIVLGQMPVKEWHGFIGDPALADALLDRLVHSSLKIGLKGESMRKLKSADAR